MAYSSPYLCKQISYFHTFGECGAPQISEDARFVCRCIVLRELGANSPPMAGASFHVEHVFDRDFANDLLIRNRLMLKIYPEKQFFVFVAAGCQADALAGSRREQDPVLK